MSDINTIRLARCLASKKFPYLSTALFSMQMIEIKEFKTMGVDAKWRCYYNEETVNKWGTEVTSSVLVHEVWHLLRKHHERIKDRIHQEWNKATDREINDDLRDLKFPFKVCLPEQIDMGSGLLAEDYYKNEKKDGGSGGGKDEKSESEPSVGGSCSDGKEREWEYKGGGEVNEGEEGLSKHQSERVIKQTAQEIKEYGKNRGSCPSNISMWADSQLQKPKVDYKRELKSRLSSIIKRGNDDLTYSKPNRRRTGDGIIFPGSFAVSPKIAVIIDTSGSMMGEGSKVLSEVNEIIRNFDDVDIISADCEIHKIQTVKNIKDVCAIGGGGTSMKNAIEKVDKMKPDVILTITDGYTDWNESPTKARQITLLTERTNQPKFGKTIFI